MNVSISVQPYLVQPYFSPLRTYASRVIKNTSGSPQNEVDLLNQKPIAPSSSWMPREINIIASTNFLSTNNYLCSFYSCVQRVGLCAGRDSCPTARPGRNFLVHGQSTNARPELQLLNISILSPGWRKAHVGCRFVSLNN